MPRLIDADAVCEECVAEMILLDCEGCVIKEHKLNKSIAPASLRPKGEWIEKEAPNMDTYYDCSACGESFCFIEGSPKDNLYCYCPNCGADMRGET